MFASLRLRQANLATIVEWIEIHFDIYIYIYRMVRNGPKRSAPECPVEWG